MKIILSILLIVSILQSKENISKDDQSIKTVAPKRESPADKIASKHFRKKGFLTTKWCADRGLFVDCKLETLVCQKEECFREWEYGQPTDTQIVLYVHDDLQYYYIKPSKRFRLSKLIESAMSRDGVTIIGKYIPKSTTIIANDFTITQ